MHWPSLVMDLSILLVAAWTGAWLLIALCFFTGPYSYPQVPPS